MSELSYKIAREKLILALDVPTITEELNLLDSLDHQLKFVKVGLELFTAAGPAAVEQVSARGYDVFLDLKLHDIPNTVAKAVRSARSLGVKMLTVHTGGGEEMLSRARDEAGGELKILGVTVLTSLSAADLELVGIAGTPETVVVQRAQLAARVGLSGIVCSPREIASVRAVLRENQLIVTPGIRPSNEELGDQKRTATPLAAIRAGADYLVVGRPIHAAADPAKAAAAIVKEISGALGER